MTSLGDLLVKAEVITPSQLSAASLHQKQSGGALARSLVELGFVSEDRLLGHLHRWFPIVDARAIDPPREALNRVPQALAERHGVVPMSLDGSTLTLATADPSNVSALREIRFLTGCDVRVVLAGTEGVRAAIKRVYEAKSSVVLEELSRLGESCVEVVNAPESEIDLNALQRATEEAPLVRLVNGILMRAVRLRASDIHIEPYRNELRVRFRIDGVLHDVLRPRPEIRAALASRLKIMATLDIAQRRMPQDGGIQLRLPDDQDVNLRVSVMPTIFGEKIVLRILEKTNVEVDLARIGFDERALASFRRAISRPHGMMIVTGPTGSGKTTTLYAALAELNDSTRNISTAEDPVEIDVPGINQLQVNEEIGLTFAAALRSFLRQDPDVIMVGEIRDLPTVEIAVRAALTGHLVLSTLHTNDAPSAVTRMLDMGIDPPLVASCLNLVVAQRLVRLSCAECRTPTEYPADVIREAGFSEEEAASLRAFRGKGCDVCGDTGYVGRAPLFEVMPLNEAIRRRVLDRASALDIRAEAVAQGMRTLRQSGLAKVREGLTTIEEVLRVTGMEE